MKISSASKKVLASALSAAMVVAFAPTVAFGAPAAANDHVTVTYNMNGGVVKAGKQEIAASVDTKITAANQIPVASGADYSKDGYAFNGYFVDQNANGVKDTDETVTVAADGTYVDNKADGLNAAAGDTVNLVAVYDVPTLAQSGSVINNIAKDDDNLLKVALTAGSSTAGKSYTATIAKDGAVVATGAYAGDALPGYLSLKFNQAADAAVLDASGVASLKADITAGTYTFTLTDVAAKKDVATATLQVVGATVNANGALFKIGSQYATTYSFLALAGATWNDALANAGISVTVYNNDGSTGSQETGKNSAGKAFAGWTVDGKAIVLTNTDPTKLSKVEASKTTAVAAYSVNGFSTAGMTYGSGQLSVTPVVLDGDYTSYDVVFANAAGKTLATKKNVKKDIAVTYSFGDTEPALGEYTATLVGNKTVDGVATATEIATAKCTLVKVVYSAGESTFKSDAAAATYSIQYAGENWNSYETPSDLVNPVKGKTLQGYWTIDGAEYKADKQGVWSLPAGTNNVVTLTAAFKATAATNATAPKYSYANGKVTLSTDMGSNYKIVFNIDDEANGSGVKIFNDYAASGSGIAVGTGTAAATKITAYVKAIDNPTASTLADSSKLVITRYDDQVTAFDGDAVVQKLSAATTDSKATAPKYYSQVLPNAKKAGEDALKAIEYASAADWAAAQLTQTSAVLKSIADYEVANIEAKATPVADAAGKNYTFSTSEQVDAAKAKVAAILDAYTVNNDGDEDNVYTIQDANGKWITKNADGTAVTKAQVGGAGYDYVVLIQNAVKGTGSSTLTAAEYSNAKAVNDMIAALPATITAADAAAVEAAANAYAGLTNKEKTMVSSADVAKLTAAQAAAAEAVAAAELKDAQDDAAVSKTRNASKTVKLAKGKTKTTKKQSVTLKAITSASGAKVTYKKSSGSSKVSVKSGKAYLAKGVKKGTYKATVKATCGTQTAKITVKFVVK